MVDKTLKVGFDLDGVILYNPIRIFRPFVASIKPFVFKKNSNKFYFPKNPLTQFIWRVLHFTSFRLNDGFENIRQLTFNNKIEAFIVTARYSFLEKDFNYWLAKIEAHNHFKHCLHNAKNEQPNVFKQRMIETLQLDYFVEDNWGVIQKLNQKLTNGTKIIWLSNYFDRNIVYPYKFFNLKEIAEFLEKQAKEK